MFPKDRLTSARFYAIIDLGYVETSRVASVTEQLVLGGVDLIQLRAKKRTLEEIAQIGQVMRDVIPPDGPALHPQRSPGTRRRHGRGRHPRRSGRSFRNRSEKARRRRKHRWQSTHALEQAIAAEQEGADYIGVGPIYATGTKPDYVPVGPPLIGQVRAAVHVPQFCIGGINEATLPKVLAAGAQRVVIVSALLQSADIPGYCRRIREQLQAQTRSS